MKDRKKFIIIIFFLIAVVTTGILGDMLFLDLNIIDALYMTVITISTVGYGEVGVMNDSAKVFTIFIIFSGLSVVGYGFTKLALKRKEDTKVIFNPSSNETINLGDTMIVLGTAEQTTFLEKIVNTAYS